MKHEGTEKWKHEKYHWKNGMYACSNQNTTYFDVCYGACGTVALRNFSMYFVKLWYGIIHLLDLSYMEAKANERNSINFPTCSQIIEQ